MGHLSDVPFLFMASSEKNLSTFKKSSSNNVSNYRIGIVVSEWNEEITESMCDGAISTMVSMGVVRENIHRLNVPGSYELTLGAQHFAKQDGIDAVVCIGCVIQGDTKHFDFICDAVANGLTNVGLKFDKPVIFGVLTPNTMQQALDRAGGKHGNKGDEAGATAINLLNALKG